MEGTRIKILNDIIDWIKDQSAQKIFWLTGWAGTGKSAIAWTICSRTNKDPEVVLGGSFFFSRSASSAAQRDVRCVIPTLAQIFARQSDVFSRALFDELTRDPDVLHKHISVQIEKLLSKPLCALAGSPVPILFVIDALDECGGQSTGEGDIDDAGTHRTVSEMLEALVALFNTDVDLPIKFLVTSRPETHIRDTPVSDHELSKVLQLQTVDKEQVTEDIRLYIGAKLMSTSKLRTRFKSSDADMLSQQCDGLFIVATTALKYTFERGHDAVATRFRTMLNASRTGLSTGAAAPLDRMYTLILEDAARMDEPGGDGLAGMLQLLAVLMSTRMVLSVTALADLFGRPADDTRAALSRLHAVVHVPEYDEEPGLRTLHASFGDYIFRRAPGHVRISSSDSHEVSVRAAFRLMELRLQFNISQSRSSYEHNALAASSVIPLSLQYACTQWVYHLASLPDGTSIKLTVFPTDADVHVQVHTPQLSQFFRDANSFVASSREAIERSAPHIYLSALPFANKTGAIYKTFAPSFTGLTSIDVFGLGPHGGRLVMTLKGHEGGVTSVDYSADGLFIASGSEDSSVRVWDTRSGEETVTPLRSGSGPVTSVVFFLSGTSIAAGTGTGAVCIWRLLAGQSTLQQLIGHSKAVVSVAISSDSQFLAAASCDNTVRVWRIGTGQLFTTLRGHDDLGKGIAVSLDGEVTTSGYYYFDTTYVNDRIEGRKLRVSKTGQAMVSIESRIIRAWVRRNHDEPILICLEGHTAEVRSAVISPDSSYVASASDDGTIRIWDIESGNYSVQSAPAVSPCGSAPNRQAMSFEGARIVSVFHDDSIRVWNTKTGDTTLSLQVAHARNAAYLAVSSDEQLIAMGFGNRAQLWSAQTGEQIGELLRGDKGRVTSLVFTPNARRLASVTKYQNSMAGSLRHNSEYESEAIYALRIWDVENFRQTHSISLPSEWRMVPKVPNGSRKIGATSGYSMDISSDGSMVAAGGKAGKFIMLWQIEPNLEQLKPLQTTTSTHSIRFSPDGMHIASGGSDGASSIWNISTSQMVFKFAGHSGPVTRIIYSLDGQLIATASEDNTVRLWDAKTYASVVTLHGHRESVELLGFADSGSLVSCSADKIISVWNVNAAKSLFSESTGDLFLTLSTITPKAKVPGPRGSNPVPKASRTLVRT